MSTVTEPTAVATAAKRENLPTIAPPRLPYHPAIQERFGLDQSDWRALVDSVFPAAKTTGAVILALAYCRARKFDPFRKVVHIVPIWDKERQCEVETVWPGIAEYRTTAARTAVYAGHDKVDHGPVMERTFEDVDRNGKKYGDVTVAFPEWAQMTVYRFVNGQRCAFPGPQVYWLETYGSKKNGCPNTMWADRPIGMLDKCAEAAALRGAFPEELGGEITAEEVRNAVYNSRQGVEVPKNTASRVEALEESAPTPAPAVPDQTTESPAPEPAKEPAPQAGDFNEPGGLMDQYRDVIAQADTLEALTVLTEKATKEAFTPEQLARVNGWIGLQKSVLRQKSQKSRKGSDAGRLSPTQPEGRDGHF